MLQSAALPTRSTVADIFISYATADRPRAKLVADLLASCGWSVFWDAHIKAAADWREVLQSELDRAGAVVTLWSEGSIASDWVKEEAERGRSRLVSVRLDEVDLPLGFSRQQAVNLIGWRGGKTGEIDKLVEAVSATLRQPPKQRPKIPKSPSQKRQLAAAAVVGTALLAAYPVMQRLNRPAPIMNQEIIIDSSAGMSAPFDTAPSKLSAAIDALRARTLHPAENLALRAFGGTCHQDDESRLVVPFGTNRRNRIVKATASLQPRGQPALASSVISALADLLPLPHTKRIVVLTGHADKCQEEALREIKQRIEAYEQAGQRLSLEVRFIGLAVPPEDKQALQEMADAVDAPMSFVNTVKELNDVLEYVLEFEPGVTHVRAVWDVVGTVAKSLSDIPGNMNARKFDEAERINEAGRTAYARMKPSFDGLAGREASPNFERFYALAGENRQLQEQLLEIVRTAVGQGKASGEQQSPEYGESIKKWNEVVAKYNASIDQMNRLTDEIVKEVRKGR